MNERFSDIPKTDSLLLHSGLLDAIDKYGYEVVAVEAKAQLANVREGLKNASFTGALTVDAIATEVLKRLEKIHRKNLVQVINASGIPLHTNLGRAPMSEAAAKAAYNAALGYCNLEFDLELGERGSRHSHIENLLCRLTGAEAAMAVNNNAAAVMLMLAALCSQKQVVVSRGELVEIGGSFRIPDIMSLTGAVLKEIGTTNKTHLADYENAVTVDTGALLKVHTSNYIINGFTASVELAVLSELCKKRSLPLLYDLGSGSIFPLAQKGIGAEPVVKTVIENGADVVCFSGDKLLGGPQTGILIGKKKYIDKLKKHPLARAVRIDKMSIAALEATLLAYLNPKQAGSLPLIEMLLADEITLKQKAQKLSTLLKDGGVENEVSPWEGEVGGGSMPTVQLRSFAVLIQPKNITLTKLEKKLRNCDTPVVAMIQKNKLVFDLRTVFDTQIEELAKIITDNY